MSCIEASSRFRYILAGQACSSNMRLIVYAGEAAAATSTASLAKQEAEMRALSPVKVTPSDSSSARLRRTLGVSSPCMHAAQQSEHTTGAWKSESDAKQGLFRPAASQI